MSRPKCGDTLDRIHMDWIERLEIQNKALREANQRLTEDNRRLQAGSSGTFIERLTATRR